MSVKGQKMPSARHKFSLGRIIACVAICVVAFCAVLTGVGYGLGWFTGDEEAPQDVSTETVESDEQNTDKNEAADDALTQDADVSVEAEAIATDPADDQADQADETALNPDSEAVVSEEDILTGNDVGIPPEDSSGDEPSSIDDQNSNQSIPSDINASSQSEPDQSEQSERNSDSSSVGDTQYFTITNGAEESSVADTDESTAESAAQTVTVSVYIDSSRAAPYGYPSCLGDMTVSITQGSSVLDALKATNLAISATNSGYVSSISGLAERACGSGSGWLYFVNGVSPSSSCSKYILNGGEKIEWIYTCDMGNDV